MKNRIMVIEDEQPILDLICMNLEAAGYETMTASDGAGGGTAPVRDRAPGPDPGGYHGAEERRI